MTPEDWVLLAQRMLDAVDEGRRLPVAASREAIVNGRALPYYARELGLRLDWEEAKQQAANRAMAQAAAAAERDAARHGIQDGGCLGVACALHAMRMGPSLAR